MRGCVPVEELCAVRDFKGTIIVAMVQSGRCDALQCYHEVPEGEREGEKNRERKRKREGE
jgi:hypothetical protein